MSTDVQSLSRGVSSLALMLKGFDRQMDEHLSTLRQVLKDKDFHISAFNSALEEVEKIYDDVEGVSESSIETYSKAFEVLFDGQLVDVLAPLKSAHPAISDLLKLAEPLASQINVLSKTHATESTNDPLLDDLRRRLANRFKTLLHTLMLMGDDDGPTADIAALFEGSPDWDTLDQLAVKTIELLQSRLNQEKKQFEGYLAQLTAKLNRINQIVATDSKTLNDLKQLNVTFNASMTQQMSDARQKIDENHEVTSLKSGLLESLDTIASRLEDYQRDYQENLMSLQSSKMALTKHIEEIEQEKLELMEKLKQERRISLMDTLTQLPNRLSFSQRLNEELSRVDRYQQSISVAIIDIDFFKRINDDFGHLVGDKVLRMISNEMRKALRECDFLARYGGEEFILLMPETQLSNAVIVAEKIRAQVESCPFHYQHKPVKMTVSIGVAQQNEDESSDDWIDRADKALYESKKTGRNKLTAARHS